jgi:hypothetical protein
MILGLRIRILTSLSNGEKSRKRNKKWICKFIQFLVLNLKDTEFIGLLEMSNLTFDKIAVAKSESVKLFFSYLSNKKVISPNFANSFILANVFLG